MYEHGRNAKFPNLKGRCKITTSVYRSHDLIYWKLQRLHKILLELIIKFSKFARYEIDIQKSVVFLYSKNELSKKEIKKTVPFKIASQSIKYLEINLSEEVKNSFTENYITLMKHIKEDMNNWKNFFLFPWCVFGCFYCNLSLLRIIQTVCLVLEKSIQVQASVPLALKEADWGKKIIL